MLDLRAISVAPNNSYYGCVQPSNKYLDCRCVETLLL
jgi:hypothetical protein